MTIDQAVYRKLLGAVAHQVDETLKAELTRSTEKQRDEIAVDLLTDLAVAITLHGEGSIETVLSRMRSNYDDAKKNAQPPTVGP